MIVSSRPITNEDVVKLIFAVDSMNRAKKVVPRYTCGKECKCQTCKNSQDWELGKKDTCWCHRPRLDNETYFDDITPCTNGGFKECPYYKNI